MTRTDIPKRKACPWPSYSYEHGPHVWHTTRQGEPIAERAVNRWSVAYKCFGKRTPDPVAASTKRSERNRT